MSQVLNKKKGFVAPFQASAASQVASAPPFSSGGPPPHAPPSASAESAAPPAAKTPKKKKKLQADAAAGGLPLKLSPKPRPLEATGEAARPKPTPKKQRPKPAASVDADPATWDPTMLSNIDAAIDAAIGGGDDGVPDTEQVPGGRGGSSEGGPVRESLHPRANKGGAAAEEDEASEGSDGAADCPSVPAAEPALPIGSVLAADRRQVELTPLDAPQTLLTTPPAVFKRPVEAAPASADSETEPPPVKRRLYSDKPRPPKGTAGRRKPSESADHTRGEEARRPNQKERILELQRRRTSGTWVQCCHIDCGKWRYLDHVKDPAEIPLVWHCNMNADGQFGWCSAPQQHIANSAFPRLVQVRFTVGSVVWAHLDGFPWWPAVVDDDPDIEDFCWLDGFSEIPTHYHVTFLDGPQHEVTRAWVGPAQVKKFQSSDDVKTCGKTKSRGQEYAGRLAAAVQVAREALSRPLEERRRRYTFVARYRGPWAVYSDSDAETGRLTDGRRPVRRKKRDRRARRPRPDKLPAAPRRRAAASSRSGSVSSSCSRDSQTVNSLMDVVDDIVSQLTQSQSQSQSRRGDAAIGDDVMFTDTSGSTSDVDSGDLPPAGRGASSEHSGAEDDGATRPGMAAEEAGQAPGVGLPADGENTTKKAAVKATGVDSVPRLKSKPKNSGGDSQTVQPAAKPKKTKAPTPKSKKLSALAPPAEKPSFTAKKKTKKNVRAAESKFASQETPEHARPGALTRPGADNSARSDAPVLSAASAPCPPDVPAKPKKAKKPFSVPPASQPSAPPPQDVESDAGAGGEAAELARRENPAGTLEPPEEGDATSAVAEDVSRDGSEGPDGVRSPVADPRLPVDCCGGSDAEEGGPALLSAAAGEGSPDLVLPTSPAAQAGPLDTPTTEPSTLFEPAPPTPSPRSYTEQQSEFTSRDATAQSQEMFDVDEDATGADGDAGEDSDPFEADD